MQRHPQYTCTTYAVSFHDVLDQGSKLMLWDDLSKLDSPDSAASSALSQTINTVRQIREHFAGFRSGLNASTYPTPEEESLVKQHPKLGEALTQVRSGRIHAQAFSDTNIWFTPLRDGAGTFFSRTALHLVAGTAFSHLLALSDSVPCRGAIEIGSGTDAFAGEIYGPVLLKAHRLETLFAEYPRVVIGDHFASYVASIPEHVPPIEGNEESTRLLCLYHQTHADWIRELIFMDDDGLLCLDFAGEAAAKRFIPHLQNAGFDPREVFSKALAFAGSSLKIFLDSRNSKLAGRYNRLNNYLEQCKPHWL